MIDFVQRIIMVKGPHDKEILNLLPEYKYDSSWLMKSYNTLKLSLIWESYELSTNITWSNIKSFCEKR